MKHSPHVTSVEGELAREYYDPVTLEDVPDKDELNEKMIANDTAGKLVRQSFNNLQSCHAVLREKASLITLIELYDNEVISACFEQEYSVNLSASLPMAFYKSKEEYYSLNTGESNVFDEYYLFNNKLYVKRVSAEDETQSSNDSTIEVFWEIVTLDSGETNYKLKKNIFSEYKITKNKDGNSITAKIKSNQINGFFGREVDGISNVSLEIKLYKDGKLKQFNLEYSKSNYNYKIETLKNYENISITYPEWAY